MLQIHAPFRFLTGILLGALLALPAATTAQDRPDPEAPDRAMPVAGDVTEPVPNGPDSQGLQGPDSRRDPGEGQVVLAFDDVSVEETLGFIVETTGKVVVPINLAAVRTRKITLMNDAPINRAKALDLLFAAFRLNGVGVIERDDVIIIGTLDLVVDDIGDLPVLDARVDVMARQDRGTLVIKIFPVLHADAQGIGDRLAETFPDYGTLSIDPISNQIIVLGDIGLCQQVQHIITELDRIWTNATVRTYRLAYADANEIATNILDLFEESTGTSRTTGTRTTGTTSRARQTGGTATTGGAVELRLTVNVQQNTVTVQGEPSIIEQVTDLISTQWDLPRDEATSKVYHLAYTDPLKVRDLLREVLGQGSGTTGTRTQARGGQATQGRADVQQAISGIYQIEAFPDQRALVVLSKTKDSIDFLDTMIEQLDQPTTIGLPLIVQLKHANAIRLSEELNALLAEAGRTVSLDRPDTGLSGEGFTSEGEGGTSGGAAAGGRSATAGGAISFPWQQGGGQAEDQSPESAIIGKVRIVPIVRQNALAILAPPAFQSHVLNLIDQFDRPGRQVLLSATIVEVELTDSLALGLRFGDAGILSGLAPDAQISTSGDIAAQDTSLDLFSNFFTSATLDISTSVTAVIQALNQVTNVRILQEPQIFTADNEEAIFFDGEDLPIITDTQTTDQGGLTQSFTYRAVGVLLNVRPRITAEGDVDIEINLELSSDTGRTGVGQGAIISRRQATSQVVVKNGQTIVLSGILKEIESQTRRKIPLLGDLPIIGDLFTSTEDSLQRTELIAFITPTVVENPSANDDNYNREHLERAKEITRPLEEQLEEGRIETNPPGRFLDDDERPAAVPAGDG